MKVNFNPDTSNLTHKGFDNDPNWLKYLVERFSDFCDLDLEKDDVLDWIYSPEGADVMVSWMKSRGYKCEYFQILKVNSGDDLLAYGIDVADNCEKFVELKLSL